MTGEADAEVLVVGLGLVGSGALRHLATAGASAIGIGPAEPTGPWSAHRGAFASHYDSGRITRMLDARFEWAELAVRSIAAYPAIADAGDEAFHVPAGVAFASTDEAYIAALAAVGERVGATFDVRPPPGPGRVTAADGLLAFDPGSTVVAEPGPAGLVDPRRMAAAQLRAAQRHGATVVRDEVAGLRRLADGRWEAASRHGATWRGERVVVATGAHTDELAGVGAAFAGTVRPETVVLATLDAAEQRRLADLPSVLAHLDGTSFSDLYQVPPTPYPDGSVRLKLGATLRRWDPLATAGARRAWMAGDAHRAHLDELRALTEALVPGVRALAWETKPCMITDTPSGLPIVDHLDDALVLAAGGNGYAAKSSDAIGALAAGLVLEGRWTDPVLDAAAFARR